MKIGAVLAMLTTLWCAACSADVQPASSTWSAPPGYSRVDSVPTGTFTNYLWVNRSGKNLCWLVESVDEKHAHQGSVGACGEVQRDKFSLSRLFGSLVGSVPDPEAEEVVLKTPQNGLLVKVHAHEGVFLTQDIAHHDSFNVTTVDSAGNESEPSMVQLAK